MTRVRTSPLCDLCHTNEATRFWQLTGMGWCKPCADRINYDRNELGMPCIKFSETP